MKIYLKIAALAATILLILGLGFFANAFLGNPLSKYLAKKAVNTHLANTYSHLDVYVDKLGYSFKTTDYYAHIKSRSSIDTEFVLHIDWRGSITYDTYEDQVTNGYNTAHRLDSEYRTLTDSILENPAFPYQLDFGFGTLQFLWDEGETPEYGIGMPASELELDKLYDVREMGARYGVLIIYLDDEDITFARTAEILLTIRELFDDAGIPFSVIDLTMRQPKNEDETRPDEKIYAELAYEDIYPTGLEERVEKSHNAKTAYYDALDAKE